MTRRSLLPLLPFVLIVSLGATALDCRMAIVHSLVDVPGYVEPHTPGSGLPEEFATTTTVDELMGPDIDLNRISYIRTSQMKPTGPPRAIMILIPGFLGGGSTFDPIARDLVRAMGGNLEVWAIDRRPNQLEDRIGARHAATGALLNSCGQPGGDCSSIFEGAQFYFPDLNVDPQEDFPGPGDLDVNLNGVDDPQLPLEDQFGNVRAGIQLAQDDARFMAHWGIDTYMRDWGMLAQQARNIVGEDGLVLLGGHSQGTTWATTFAAYDLDPDPNVTVAGHSLIDGLILLEGGGVRSGAESKASLAEYQATVDALEAPGGPDVFLAEFSAIPLASLGTSGEVAAVAGAFQPDEPSLIQRTPTFGSGLVSILLSAPTTNRAVVGLFLDDDFSPIGAFRASVGFTVDGPNQYLSIPGLLPAYLAHPEDNGGLRTWLNIDDPGLPVCGPGVPPADGRGCAIIDNGPPSDPNDPNDPPRANGVEVEVTDIGDFLRTQYGKANGFEWYFVDGRVSLDFSYGNDSSALVAEHLAVDPNDEGPLRITQHGSMDLPVLGIGGSNGLTPEAKSFDRYLGSIATPDADKQVVILEGYAHLDPINARENGAVPPILDMINRLLQRKLLETF